MAQGCYTPLYVPASFKGVAFEAEEVSSEHGRRGAEGEFPFSNNTAYVDLGRKIRRYSLKGRYVTNAHLAASNAFIAACESPGPGLLVHPTRGAVLVACTKLVVSDDPLNEQGITHLDMEFVEAQSVATGFSLGAAIFGLPLTAITAAVGVSFELAYDIDNVRFYRLNEVENTLSEAMESIKREFAKAAAKNPSISKWTALATMQGIVDDPTSIRDADAAFEAFRQAIRTLANATESQVKYDSFKAIANDMAQVSSLPEEAGIAQNAVYAMVRTLAVVNMVKAALETDVTTLDLALDQYDEVVSIMTDELASARSVCDDDLYIELRKFETEAKVALLDRAYNLPTLISYDFGGGVHSLVAAYEIFDDAKRFAEIEMRNPSYWPWAVGPEVIAAKV